VLRSGPQHWFRDWPAEDVPRLGAGVYAVWDADALVYVGMSGRSSTVATETRRSPYGLCTRLASHAGGRRSGDQFCEYVADCMVLADMSSGQLAGVADGAGSMDDLVRAFIAIGWPTGSWSSPTRPRPSAWRTPVRHRQTGRLPGAPREHGRLLAVRASARSRRLAPRHRAGSGRVGLGGDARNRRVHPQGQRRHDWTLRAGGLCARLRRPAWISGGRRRSRVRSSCAPDAPRGTGRLPLCRYRPEVAEPEREASPGGRGYLAKTR